jgi:hypothetical protein
VILRSLVLAALLVGGCSMYSQRMTVDERTTQGPRAEDFWEARMRLANGRPPNFEERQHFFDDLSSKIGRYLREHQEAANNPLTLQAFRFVHQVTAGMDAGQVAVLLGEPLEKSTDAAHMANLARRHWGDLRGRTDEAWVYPFGWTVYLDKAKVVDLVQYVPGLIP